MVRNNVRRVAEALGYKMADLIKGTGLSKNAVYRVWHNETEQIAFDTLDKLCMFLKVPIGDLIEHVPDDQMTPEDHEHLEERRKGIEKVRSYNSKK